MKFYSDEVNELPTPASGITIQFNTRQKSKERKDGCVNTKDKRTNAKNVEVHQYVNMEE